MIILFYLGGEPAGMGGGLIKISATNYLTLNGVLNTDGGQGILSSYMNIIETLGGGPMLVALPHWQLVSS